MQWALSSNGVQGLGALSSNVHKRGGVEILDKKHIETSMQYVHGVGQILLNVGLENKITSKVSELELANIYEELCWVHD